MHQGRKLAALGIALAASVALAGCAGSGAAGTGGSTGGSTLTYWSMWEENEPQAQVLKNAIAEFTKHTHVKVNVQWQGRSVLTKVAPTIRSGGSPDLVDQDSGALYSTLADAYTDLGSVYDSKIPGEKVTVAESGVGAYRKLGSDPKSGKAYTVPYEVFAYGTFFNGTTHPDVAANPPKTFDQYISVLDELKAKGRQPLAVDGSVGTYTSLWLAEPLQHALGPGGFDKLVTDKTGQSWTKDARVTAVLGQVQKIVDGHYFLDGSFGSKYPAIQEKWAGGGSDFLINGSWITSEVAKSVSSDWSWNQFSWPSDGAKPTVLTGMIGFAIPSTSKDPAAAKQLITYVLKKENQQAFVNDTSNLVPRTDVTPPKVLADLSKVIKDGADVQSAFGTVSMLYPTYSTEVLDPTFLKFLAGQTDAAAFAKQMADAQARFWTAQAKG